MLQQMGYQVTGSNDVEGADLAAQLGGVELRVPGPERQGPEFRAGMRDRGKGVGEVGKGAGIGGGNAVHRRDPASGKSSGRAEEGRVMAESFRRSREGTE